MCRFCACNIAKNELSKKCSYKKNDQEHEVPWSTKYICVDYQPSNFIQPKNYAGLPVIVNGKHLSSEEDQIFCPMFWSLVPSSFNEDLQKWDCKTHNARIENLKQSKIYSAALGEGKRCVVVMEGFYEYHKPSPDRPADVYFLQSQKNDQLLKAAGLFTLVKNTNGNIIPTCTVITAESECNAQQVHHRIPVLLQDNLDIEAWLDYNKVSSSDAVDKIKSKEQPDLKFYKTDKVGSREPKSAKKSLASKSIMSNWLNVGKGVKRKADS
ncbi:embryonic stem cell-specific 5-hydroxymethylcytosine-binding protein isoform X1 [Trichogramma pretiosum]|uniref:embryonic stem cell-specific 5-hydroxymethylcytosine-binding protein isoform X1 n=1 Tax=Trichogramma pretiosum TaxID=7493 RepID=UPI0006C99BE9|nr:embryonic stem cell-specific 5-hydroxymethylcytosine-binding protein isoform X1 [Trichogramma pretiosum]